MNISQRLKGLRLKASDAFLTASILTMVSLQEAVGQTLDLTQDPTGGKNLDGLLTGGGKTLFGQIAYWLFQVLAPFVGGWLVFKGFMKIAKENPNERDGWWRDILIGFLLIGFTFLVFRLRNTIMTW